MKRPSCRHRGVCSIVPPYMLEALATHEDAEVREAARSSLLLTERLRGRRPLEALLARLSPLAPLARSHDGSEQRRVFTSNHTTKVPGMIVRQEGDPPSHDPAIDEAYDAAGIIYAFYREVLGRNSVDDRGMHLLSSVHYAHKFDNAFWNGLQMVYGDGDGKVFGTFTSCVDVIGHEMTHGVVQTEADLAYEGEPGALNESIADVFGTLAKQWHLKQSVDQADWLIGAGLLKHKGAKALRSLKAPGTAYDDPALGGKDPQPAHMRDFVHMRADDGGVHVNSGIPNHAFFLFATALGGNAWEVAGKIWYETLCSGIRATTDFHGFARATAKTAGAHGEAVGHALVQAWDGVGIKTTRS